MTSDIMCIKSLEIKRFPFPIKRFFFKGDESPDYVTMYANEEIIGHAERFTRLYKDDNLWEVHFFDEQVDLPLHLVMNTVFKFTTNRPGTLNVEESAVLFDQEDAENPLRIPVCVEGVVKTLVFQYGMIYLTPNTRKPPRHEARQSPPSCNS
jgi:hypothetical protein